MDDGISSRIYGGDINEKEFCQESSAKSCSKDGNMRNVWSYWRENEPASYRLYKAYGGNGSLYEMPCKGTFKTSNFCNMCGLREIVCGEMASKNSKDLQQRMPCVVWENMRSKAMEHFWDNGEPNIPRVIDRIQNRVDRIRSLGNAVVPQQFYLFFKLIADIEKGCVK